jgi:hypothetical protein
MSPGRSPALIVTLFADRRSIDLDGIANQLHRVLAQSGERPLLRLVGGADGTLPAPADLASDIDQLATRATVVLVAIRGPFLQDVLVAFDRADRAVAFTDGSVPSVRDLRRMLKLTASLGLGMDRVHVVLLEGGEGALDPSGLASALQRDVLAVLPSADAPAPARLAAYRDLARRLLGSDCLVPNGNT